ncbi:MAG: DLW-39 family protein [Spirochaetaceae bacterium]|nr:DLW-39 family protein [Spirochaetaceae bacterium]
MSSRVSGKVLAAAIAAVGGLLAYRKVVADREAEQDLWAEVTDKP